MKQRALRIIVLLWAGWYFTGPAAEMVDFWDTPPQEMRDIARSAGGMVALIGVTIAIALSQIRRLREYLRRALRPWRDPAVFRFEARLLAPALFPSHDSPCHSPPIPLRI